MRRIAFVFVALAACKSGGDSGDTDDSDTPVETDIPDGNCVITGGLVTGWNCQPILLYEESYELWSFALAEGSPNDEIDRVLIQINGTGVPQTGTFRGEQGNWSFEVSDNSGGAWDGGTQAGGTMELEITELGTPVTYTYGIEYHGTVGRIEMTAPSTTGDGDAALHIELPMGN